MHYPAAQLIHRQIWTHHMIMKHKTTHNTTSLVWRIQHSKRAMKSLSRERAQMSTAIHRSSSRSITFRERKPSESATSPMDSLDNRLSLKVSCIVAYQEPFLSVFNISVDGSQAGSGNLEILVNGGRVTSSVRALGGQRFVASFTPHENGIHSVQITFNGETVPGEWNSNESTVLVRKATSNRSLDLSACTSIPLWRYSQTSTLAHDLQAYYRVAFARKYLCWVSF